MDKTIGFIGAGNMGKAIINGLISSKLVGKNHIIASAKTEKTRNGIKSEFGIEVFADNKAVANKSNYLILAVKPNMHTEVLEEISSSIRPQTVVITIAAGISIDFLKGNIKNATKFVKAMPNTPARVGLGMTAISVGKGLDKDESADVLSIFNSFGRAEIVDEKLMDGVTAVSGSSPAYVYMMIEAMADGAVLQGMKRDAAYVFAAQAVMGAAKMVLETGIHPGVLKDNVCSPGGTTIEAVSKLEEMGFRAAILEAMKVCADKSRKMNAQ
jgi:pyrroline-5-carboxylate reductase